MTSELRALTLTEILDGSFAHLRRHLGVCLATAALFLWPRVLIERIDPLLSILVAPTLGALATVACSYLASAAVRGREVRTGDAIRATARISGFVVLFGNGLAILVAAALGGAAIVLLGSAAAGSAVGSLLGLALLVAAFAFAIVLGVAFYTWPAVLVNEITGWPFPRCIALSRGAFGKTFVVWLLARLIVFAPASVLVGASVLTADDSGEVSPLLSVSGFVLECILVPFGSAVLTLLYFDQRVRREGLDVQLAAEELERELADAEAARDDSRPGAGPT